MEEIVRYKIKLIACYIGPFPDCFSLWLRSCEKNPTVDFMVVTDQEEPEWYPKNVSFLKTNLSEIKIRFEKKSNFNVSLEKPYKLCDFRPLYGLAFEDELFGYDFWGHCDIDLIWGNIRSYIKDEILEKYERIGGLGHFSIYKNTQKMNNIYCLPGGIFSYEKVFKNQECFAFDEISGINLICKENNILFFEDINIADISYYYTRIREDREYNPFELYYWDNGHCYRSYLINQNIFTEEFMYIHFQKRKLKDFSENSRYINSFFIKEDGFYERDSKGTEIDFILKHCVLFKDEEYEQKEKRQFKINKVKSMIRKNWREIYIWIKQQLAFKRYKKQFSK